MTIIYLKWGSGGKKHDKWHIFE